MATHAAQRLYLDALSPESIQTYDIGRSSDLFAQCDLPANGGSGH